MTIGNWLVDATTKLRAAGIESARLDCLILLEDILNTNRTQILAHLDDQLTEVKLKNLEKMIDQRATHLPLAYIRGKAEFYGREFQISEHVLQPRPETETIIDMVKLVNPNTIIDIGTGSGALAITASLEKPGVKVIATDIDTDCLAQAKQNAQRHKCNIMFLLGDLLDAIPANYLGDGCAILANLPYVPDAYRINKAAKYEPAKALFGGDDGLDLYRTLFDQLASAQAKNISIFTESLLSQHDTLTTIATQAGYHLVMQDGLVQHFTSPS